MKVDETFLWVREFNNPVGRLPAFPQHVTEPIAPIDFPKVLGDMGDLFLKMDNNPLLVSL